MFSTKSCMVLGIIFMLLIHFELIFVYDVREAVQLHSFGCGNPEEIQPFVEETILYLLSGLGTLVKNQLAIDVWVYFWTLNSIPLVHISILISVLQFFVLFCFVFYCKFVINFKIEKYKSSIIVLFLEDCLGYLEPLTISYEFGLC